MEALVGFCIFQVERRLSTIPDAQKESHHRQFVEVRSGKRAKGPIGEGDGEPQGPEKERWKTRCQQKFRRQKVCSRRVEEPPISGAGKVLPFAAKLHPVVSLLPADII